MPKPPVTTNPPDVSWTDAALCTAAGAGEDRAWRVLVERYERLVFAVIRRTGIGSADADEAFQGVFLEFFRRMHTIRDIQSLPKWLIMLAHRQALKIRHRNKASREREISVGTTEPAMSIASSDLESLETQRVARGLQELGGRCEHLLRLLFSDRSNTSYSEVGAALGIPTGSIGPTRERCLKKLAEILAELGE
jgi:RNA polymerase sigma factor (sigma-70 family)